MPGFGGARLQYRDTRTLPYNQRFFELTQTSTYEATGCADPAIDSASIVPLPPYGYEMTNPGAGVALSVMNRGRVPSAFRTTPGPGMGHFTPAGG
jgi:hypothetical protein